MPSLHNRKVAISYRVKCALKLNIYATFAFTYVEGKRRSERGRELDLTHIHTHTHTYTHAYTHGMEPSFNSNIYGVRHQTLNTRLLEATGVRNTTF